MDSPVDNSLIQPVLLPGEKVLWSGNSTFSFPQFLMMKVKGLYGYIILLWILLTVVVVFLLPGSDEPAASRASTAQAIWWGCIFFVIAAFVFWVFRIYRNFKNDQLYAPYAVTNQRILIRQNKLHFSAPLATLPGMIKANNRNGVGTIQFQIQGTPTFYLIKDVDKVYQLINEAQKANFND